MTPAGIRSSRNTKFLPLVTLTLCWANCATSEARPVADRVYGQPNLNSHVAGNPLMPMNARLRSPKGVGVSSAGVFIADEYSSRVLFFPHGKTLATRVYGQADFESTYQNYRGLSASSLALPKNIDASDAGLVVGDFRNSRAVFYPTGEMTARFVYGQPHAEATTPNYTGNPAYDLKYPEAATVDRHGGVYVADSMEARIAYYPPGQKTADRSYYGTGVGTESRFGVNQAVAIDDSGLYVADTSKNRVVFFPHGSMVATRIYGQPDFNSTDLNNGGIHAGSLKYPLDIALDSEGVYIADSGNNRVLYYPGESTTATLVYGQPDFSTGVISYGATGVGFPMSIAADDTALFVADTYGGRVLRFPKYNAPVANRMAVTVQPSGGVAAVPFSTQPVVTVLQANGEVATGYNGPVILSLVPDAASECARLRGATNVHAVNGVATFTDVWVDAPGTHRLEAQAGTLTEAVSEAFVIEPNPAVRLAGDFDLNGVVNIADTVLGLRVLAGLDVFPGS